MIIIYMQKFSGNNPLKNTNQCLDQKYKKIKHTNYMQINLYF